MVDQFAEKHDVGLEYAVAAGAQSQRGCGTGGHGLLPPGVAEVRILCATSSAGGTAVGAVQFDNLAAAGLLVEDVDILGDHPGQATRLFPFSQPAVGKGRPDILHGVDEIPREFVKILRAAPKPADLEDLLGIVPPGYIQPLRSPEIRDARCRGDAGTGKSNHTAGLPDQRGAAYRLK